jgi:hypothetical protein
MAGLQYDSHAFVYFLLTMLVMYLVPASLYIASTAWSFRAAAAAAPTLTKPRSRAEAEQAARQRATAAAGARPVLWTRNFKILVGVTVAAALLTTYLLLSVGSGSDLAQYDPYAVRRRAAAAAGEAARRSLGSVGEPVGRRPSTRRSF